MPESIRNLRETTVKYYVGDRDGCRIILLVPGRIDDEGRERISATEARKVEAVIRGSDYHALPHIAEPIGSSRVEHKVVSSTSHRPIVGYAAS